MTAVVARLGATVGLLLALPYHAGKMLGEPLGARRDAHEASAEALAALPR